MIIYQEERRCSMGMVIYYFSGTGNSLHVARELHRRIPESKLIPIISLLNENVIETTAETVGFVFPIYLTAIPSPVRRFLKKLDLKSSRYTFAICTYADAPGLVNTHLAKILKNKGKSLDAYFTIKMAGNSPKYIMPNFMMKKDWTKRIAKEKISELESKVLKELDSIQRVVIRQEKYLVGQPPHNIFLEQIIPVITENMNIRIDFYTDIDCTGCGLCENVCLSGMIKIIDGRPIWQKSVHCYYCYACFNFCPRQSILINNAYTEKNGRYYHPDISANDIADQKDRLYNMMKAGRR